jgi:hypothetical protein
MMHKYLKILLIVLIVLLTISLIWVGVYIYKNKLSGIPENDLYTNSFPYHKPKEFVTDSYPIIYKP